MKFLCPICYSEEYDKRVFRFTFYECKRCSVIFFDPEKFSAHIKYLEEKERKERNEYFANVEKYGISK